MRFMMIYRAVRQILSDGADIALQSNQRGDLAVQEQYVPDYEDNANDVAWTQTRATPTATGAWNRTSSAGTKTGNSIPAIIKATGGRVRRVRFHNYGTSTPTLFLKNKAAILATSDTPDYRETVAAGTATVPTKGAIDFGPDGASFATGIAIGFSSSIDTFTAMATNDIHYEIDWI